MRFASPIVMVAVALCACSGADAPAADETPVFAVAPHPSEPVRLGAGFAPDPRMFTGIAGGAVDAATMSAACRGHVGAEPNHVLELEERLVGLRVLVSAAFDTALIVQRPDGSYACNDDYDGLNPGLQGDFEPGVYRVWVASLAAQRDSVDYRLAVTSIPLVASGTLGAVASQLGEEVAIPTDCGMEQAVFGPLGIGSQVVLQAHRPWTGRNARGEPVEADSNWIPDMQRFVGQRAIVVLLSGLDDAGCPGVRVDIDERRHFWRVRDVTVQSSDTAAAPTR